MFIHNSRTTAINLGYADLHRIAESRLRAKGYEVVAEDLPGTLRSYRPGMP